MMTNREIAIDILNEVIDLLNASEVTVAENAPKAIDLIQEAQAILRKSAPQK